MDTVDIERTEHIDPRQFRDVGFLQEVNRRFFHPLGLALEVNVNSGPGDLYARIRDHRDDPEGMVFAKPPDRSKAMRVDDEAARHRQARIERFGWDVQPVGPPKTFDPDD